LLISEFMAANSRGLTDEDGDYSDWIELHNAGPQPVDLDGWHLTDDASQLRQWRFPATNLVGGGHLIVFASNKDRRVPGRPLHTNFRLANNGEYLALVRPDGLTVAHAYVPAYPPQVPNVAFGLGQELTATKVVRTNGPARVLVPANGQIAWDWTGQPFDDSAWHAGTNGVGFDAGQPASLAPAIATDVRAAMHGQNASAYVRLPFETTAPDTLQSLKLRVRYNDGFVAFLNGAEVARRNAPSEAAGGRVADSVAQFSGEQGQHGWFYGYYLKSADLDGVYQVRDFRPFPRSDDVHSPDNFWTGAAWEYFALDPIPTSITASHCHPSGFNSGPEHWVVRRWVSSVTGTLTVNIRLAKAPPTCGNGVTGRMYHNGAQRYSRTLLANDTTGLTTNLTLANVAPGDWLDFVVTPVGSDVQTNDACDQTLFQITIDQAPSLALTWDSAATVGRSNNVSLQYEEFDISGARKFLLPGVNVLALQGLNVSAGNSNFLVQAELEAGVAPPLQPDQPRYFTTPTPGRPNGAGTADLGPILSDVSHYPNVPEEHDQLIVRGRFTPALQPITARRLHYRVMYNPEVVVPMWDDGAHGDGAAGDGLFGGVIPASAASSGQMVRWYITAVDSGSRTSRWPLVLDPVNSPQYLGTIIHVAQTNPLPILHWFAQSPDAANNATGTRCSLFYDGEFYDNVGVNLHGQSSSGFPKKSYDIDFNPGHNFRYARDAERVDDINLLTTYPDKAHLRNLLAYETYAAAGAPYHFVYPVRVHQNGTFYGDAHLMENGDANYLARLGLDPNGAFYKMYNDFRDTNDYIIGVNGAFAEKKTRKHEGNADLMALFSNVVAQVDISARTAYLYDHWNIPAFINFLAARVITGDRDCCHKNYYLYRDSDRTREWQPMPWDVDLSFGRNWISSLTYWDDTIHATNQPFVGGNNGLFMALTNTPALRQMYFRRLRTLMDEFLQPPGTPEAELRYERRLAELYPLIAPDAALDLAKWGTWGNGAAQSACCVQTMAQAIELLRANYLVSRRTNLFNRLLPLSNEIPSAQPTNVVILFGAIEYLPASTNQAEEYIELVNTNRLAVDLSGWGLRGAVDYTFRGGVVMPSNSVLYVAADVTAFRARQTGPRGGRGLFVQGDYTGQLSARGETLWLLDAMGRTNNTVTYAGAPSDAQRFLRVTELMYHPPADPAGSSADADEFEYVELKNIGPHAIDLTGVRFTSGIEFAFGGSPAPSLGPGESALLVKNRAAFTARYGAGFRIAGEYLGTLDNDGERVQLEDRFHEKILEFRYNDAWYPVTDGAGFSLVIVDEPAPFNTWDAKESWRPSAREGGSPGQGDAMPVRFASILVNEVLSNTDAPGRRDTVELLNPGASAVDIGGWFLTDDFRAPKKYRIAAGTMIAAGGYQVFDERQFNANPGSAGSFGLSANGDEIYVFSADGQGELTGYAQGFRFGAASPEISLGRHTNSQGEVHFVALATQSFGTPNGRPKVGPVVIEQIMYHPEDLGGADNVAEEYLLLRNITTNAVPLFDPSHPTHTWRLRDAVDFEFPTNLVLAPGSTIVVTSFDPALAPKELAALRALYGFTAPLAIVGPYVGKLDNSSDSVELMSPETPDADGVPYVLVDKVQYADTAPWPVEPDGTGHALQRLALAEYGNDPTNWTAAYVIRPRITRQPLAQSVRPGQSASFSVWAASRLPLTYQWRRGGAEIPGATNARLDLVNIQLADDGPYQVEVRDAVGAVLSEPAQLSVLVNPAFTEQPQSQTAVAGDTVVFRVSVSGNPLPMGFRWRRNGASITNIVLNERSSALTLTDVTTNLAGGFTVVVTNAANSSPGILSGVAVLTVLEDRDGDRMPDSWERAYGFNPTNALDGARDADGDGLSNRDEYGAGTDPTNAASVLRLELAPESGPALRFLAVSNKSYSVQMREAAQAGRWFPLGHVAISPSNRLETLRDPFPVTRSRFYRVITPQPPQPTPGPFILEGPQASAARPGDEVTFEVVAMGQQPLSYQWHKDGANLPGATQPKLVLSGVEASAAGNYSVTVTDAHGSVTSHPARLSVSQN
jgi:hypothetical protein